ncbi:MAG: hypothetical protein ABUJ98_14655 [Hyphomicrobium sp.]|jgi:hypothetical protein
MSALEGKADIPDVLPDVRFTPKAENAKKRAAKVAKGERNAKAARAR